MARELNMDTQRQNFWKESIHKEAFVRLAWHGRYRPEIDAKNKEREESGEVERHDRMKRFTTMVPKVPKTSLVLPVINYPKKQKTKRDELLLRSTPSKLDADSLLTEMRPASPGDLESVAWSSFGELK